MSEVEELRAEVERLRIRNKGLWADLGQANQWSWEQHDRAESAERARDAALAEVTGLRDRLGRVEALADEWATTPDAYVQHGSVLAQAWAKATDQLRAALVVPVTGDTEDASPAAVGAAPESFSAKVDRVAATIDIGMIVEQGGCDPKELVAHILHAASRAASPTEGSEIPTPEASGAGSIEQATEGGAK